MFLKFSHDYDINIEIDGSTYTKSFTTAPDPVYASYQFIKDSSYYGMIESVDKTVIVSSMHENSVRAENIAMEFENIWWDVGKKEEQKYSELPYYVSEYVTLKTVYDLIKFSVYGVNQSIDSASLADFDIDIGDMERIKPVLDNLRERIDDLLDLIKGLGTRGNAEPKVFTPGEKGDPYPLRPRTMRSYKSFAKRNYEKRKNIFLRRNPFF